MAKLECIVSDLDASLLGSDRRISPADLNTIKKLKQKGIYFFISTGRHPDFVRQLAWEVGFDMPASCCNGGLVFDFESNNPLMSVPIAKDLAAEVKEQLDAMGLEYIIYTDESPYFSPENPRLDHWRRENMESEPQNRFEIKIIDEKFTIDEHKIIKFLIPQADEDTYFGIRERISDKERLSIMFSGKGLLDINAAGSSKGNAMEFLSKEFGFSLENTMALGDNFNDITMMKVCGIPVCPENAEQVIKDMSKHITVHHSKSPLTAAVSELFPQLI